MYQIQLSMELKVQEDCVMKMIPIDEESKMVTYLGILIPELQRFPYSFYRALEVRQFNFVGKIELLNPERIETFKKRYYNWHMMVDSQRQPQEILDHFLRLICFAIVNKSPSFGEAWQDLCNYGA
mmetsp:Transcript_32267/g.29110  ORF Transcript_32267/g.29110 Transcript_32267/m.29110 type:complete len:125 (+) Transcript_32267:390-764(+)